jgi:hypothetical protein
MISCGKADTRKLVHARVLLQADETEGGRGWVDSLPTLPVSLRAIEQVRQPFVEQ